MILLIVIPCHSDKNVSGNLISFLQEHRDNPTFSFHVWKITYIPRLLHGPDCFTVSTLCTYTDLGSQGYLGIYHHSCCTLLTKLANVSACFWVVAKSFTLTACFCWLVSPYQSCTNILAAQFFTGWSLYHHLALPFPGLQFYPLPRNNP